ncbi:unnamed protein product [Meganyctiphanes norvegica]|uniref:Protein LLP homolog n=1 Tax=Meganyctiphanes norvegica TaxID=48144 RepID=A0AAV2SRI0_MEGNR
MAKSLRSKWKRARKVEKRERYGKKETARLLKIVDGRKVKVTDVKETMKDIATVVDPISEKHEVNATGNAEEKMAVDASSKEFSSKTMQNQHGNYPKWMHKRKVEKIKKNRKNPTTFKNRKRKKF